MKVAFLPEYSMATHVLCSVVQRDKVVSLSLKDFLHLVNEVRLRKRPE